MSTVQKLIKYGAIAFGVVLIIGIFSFIFYLGSEIIDVFVDEDDDHIEEKLENSSSFSSDDFKEISIELKSAELVIENGGQFKVETNSDKIEVTKKANELKIEEKKFRLFSDKDTGRKVVITIPEEVTLMNMDIEAGAGKITIDKLTVQELSLDIGAGNVDIKKLNTIRSTEIAGGAGSVTIKDGTLHNLDLDLGVGEFNLAAILTGNHKIDAGVGNLNLSLLDQKENYTIRADKGIGSIKIDGTSISTEDSIGTGQNYIDIDGGVGNISIQFLGKVINEEVTVQ